MDAKGTRGGFTKNPKRAISKAATPRDRLVRSNLVKLRRAAQVVKVEEFAVELSKYVTEVDAAEGDLEEGVTLTTKYDDGIVTHRALLINGYYGVSGATFAKLAHFAKERDFTTTIEARQEGPKERTLVIHFAPVLNMDEDAADPLRAEAERLADEELAKTSAEA